MTARSRYGAPWGKLLAIVTGGTTLLLIGVSIVIGLDDSRERHAWAPVLTALPLVLLGAAALFSIRGYEIEDGRLTVLRPGWRTGLDLANLQSVAVDPQAMSGSIRTFGNGGLFCFAGAFRNKRLGPYRAFASDPRRSVVLRFVSRTVVVTPDRPEAFVEEIQRRAPA